jgi:hypothetical protein
LHSNNVFSHTVQKHSALRKGEQVTAIQEGMDVIKKIRWPVVWDLLKFIFRNKPEFPEIEVQLLDMKAKISILLWCVAVFILAIGANVFMGSLGWWPLRHLWTVFWEDGFSYVRMPILIIFAGIVTLAGLVYWASYLFRKWTSLGPNILWVWVGFSGLASSMAFLDRLISPSLNDAIIYIGLRTLGFKQATLYLTVLFNLLLLCVEMWGITFIGMKCLRNLAFNQMKERPDEGRRYQYVFMSMYLVISFAVMFAGYQITDLRGNIQREGSWKMYDTNPVGGTVISCKDAKDEQIACAITLWPNIGQNYSMFGDWVANRGGPV